MSQPQRFKPVATTGEQLPFRCEVDGCDVSFRRRSGMKRHLATFHGGKLFWCPFDGCDWEGAKRRYLLENHKVIKHSVENIVSLEVPDQFLRCHGSIEMLEGNGGLPASAAPFASQPQNKPQDPTVMTNGNLAMGLCITGVGQWVTNVQPESCTVTSADGLEAPINTSMLSEVDQMLLGGYLDSVFDSIFDSVSKDSSSNDEALVMETVEFDADSFWRCRDCGGCLKLFVPRKHHFPSFPCNCHYTL